MNACKILFSSISDTKFGLLYENSWWQLRTAADYKSSFASSLVHNSAFVCSRGDSCGDFIPHEDSGVVINFKV